MVASQTDASPNLKQIDRTQLNPGFWNHQAGRNCLELNAAKLKPRRDLVEATLRERVAGPRREEIAAAKADWDSQQAQFVLNPTS